MEKERVILEPGRFALTIDRLCYQLIEAYDQFEGACLIGLQPRGVPHSDRIHQRLSTHMGVTGLQYGKLDITFYRDDFRRRDRPLEASTTEMDFIVENKRVILVDDVLYTGRTVQAALTALNHYGRPASVDLLALVDRRFNRHLPIKSDFTGLRVDAVDEAYVKVEWAEHDGQDQILLFSQKKLAQS